MIQAPFPRFGGKSRVAPQVWERFGDTPNYVEPFAGSLAMLLGRPSWHTAKTETVNDLDGFVANFWRAVSHDPAAVAAAADWPVNENDKHARELYLVGQREELAARLSADPDFYDTKIAGWWVWGVCLHIGGGFCSGTGPWVSHEGKLTNRRALEEPADDAGINRQMPHLGDAGRGINRQMPHLGNAGRGVNRPGATEGVFRWFDQLSTRLRRVRVCSGDWARVMSESVTFRHGMTSVFLDPPYGEEVEQTRVYRTDSGSVSDDVRAWCLENGGNPQLRIALCGYEGEGHEALLEHDWQVLAWTAQGGYGGGLTGTGEANRHKERIYFSPDCVAEDAGLFDLLDTEEPA